MKTLKQNDEQVQIDYERLSPSLNERGTFLAQHSICLCQIQKFSSHFRSAGNGRKSTSQQFLSGKTKESPLPSNFRVEKPKKVHFPAIFERKNQRKSTFQQFSSGLKNNGPTIGFADPLLDIKTNYFNLTKASLIRLIASMMFSSLVA